MGEKRSGKREKFKMGRKFITGISGTIPSRGCKQKWDRKKNQGVKWDLRNGWEGNHSRIEEEN